MDICAKNNMITGLYFVTCVWSCDIKITGNAIIVLYFVALSAIILCNIR